MWARLDQPLENRVRGDIEVAQSSDARAVGVQADRFGKLLGALWSPAKWTISSE
jgi:hypothetical protein